MGFGQGLSGLNAASQDLDIIGNNIANSQTVGFKASTASFADVYASSRVGLGTQVSRVNQRFTIGTVEATGNQFDMAIDGQKGLFRLLDASGAVLYSRNGEFFPNKSLDLVNAQGHRLTGYTYDEVNQRRSDTLEPIKVPVGNIDPVATTNVKFETNLDGRATGIPAATTFDPADPSTYTQSYPLKVYDSLGNEHYVTQYFVKREAAAGATTVNWDVYYRGTGDAAAVPPVGGLQVTSPAAGTAHTLTFSDSGVLLNGTGGYAPIIAPIVGNVVTAGGQSPAAVMNVAFNYADSTQFGGPFAPSFDVDGYSTGEYSSMSIATDGAIQANYTNGATKTVGYIALADFSNLQGLQPVGGNAWIETSASGQPILGAPGENGMAVLKGQSVEKSNVDMSQELVKMIIAQRTYQANAQTIKTQDQILQTLITMR